MKVGWIRTRLVLLGHAGGKKAWQKLKALVLDSVSSPITRRVYNMALYEFMAWFQQAPRPGFTKATVSAWRVSLEARGLGSSSIIIRMSAIRKLAAEAADNGLLAPELAAGIARVKSVKSTGIRVGNWLSLRQAQTYPNYNHWTQLWFFIARRIRLTDARQTAGLFAVFTTASLIRRGRSTQTLDATAFFVGLNRGPLALAGSNFLEITTRS